MPECESHGEMCVLIGEIKGTVTELDAKFEKLIERLDHLTAHHQGEQAVEKWKWTMVKRGGLLAGVVSGIAASVYYVLHWLGGHR